jgi:hypothetical protein
VRVEVPEGDDQIPLAGWLYVPFLDFTEDFTTLPEFEIIESFIIHGRVFDSDGGPIEGVQVEVRQLQADGTETTRTFTDTEGNFYAYLPPESYGSWNVEIVGVDCESRIVNEDCDIVDYFLQTGSELVPIPQRETIIFIYELASTRLTGLVLDEDDEPAINVRVFAEYDRAITSGYTDEEGGFSLPAANGNWEVYTVTYNPFQAGEGVFVRIENGQQDEEPVLALP